MQSYKRKARLVILRPSKGRTAVARALMLYCYTMLCYVRLCYVMLYYIIIVIHYYNTYIYIYIHIHIYIYIYIEREREREIACIYCLFTPRRGTGPSRRRAPSLLACESLA